MQEATVIKTGRRVKLISRSSTTSGDIYEVYGGSVSFYFEWQLRGLTPEIKTRVPVLYQVAIGGVGGA
jgi:hypothetical protein